MSGVVLTCYRHVKALGKPRTQLPNFYRTIPCLHYNVSTVFPVLLNIFLPLNDVEQAMHNSVYFAQVLFFGFFDLSRAPIAESLVYFALCAGSLRSRASSDRLRIRQV